MRQAHFGVFASLVSLVVCLFAAGPSPASAEDFKQMQLTEEHIKGFISSQKELAEFAEKIQSADTAKAEEELQKELDDMAVKYGFKDFDELDDVSGNISIVMAGLDAETGDYVDPITSLKEEIEDVKADNSLEAKEKEQLLEELEEAQKTTPPLQFEENIALVSKYRAEIEKALE